MSRKISKHTALFYMIFFTIMTWCHVTIAQTTQQDFKLYGATQFDGVIYWCFFDYGNIKKISTDTKGLWIKWAPVADFKDALDGSDVSREIKEISTIALEKYNSGYVSPSIQFGVIPKEQSVYVIMLEEMMDRNLSKSAIGAKVEINCDKNKTRMVFTYNTNHSVTKIIPGELPWMPIIPDGGAGTLSRMVCR